jgi:thiamine-phosphate pyrophosphorylase
VNGASPSAAAERLRGLFVLADDDPRWAHTPVAQARAACAGGAAVVQLRAKFSTDRETLAMGREIRRITSAKGALFFVNDRFDLALLCDADGVHLGQEDLPPARLPREARRRLLVGRSTHTLQQARTARDEPCDYVALGPVFGTTSKETPYDARGLALLAEVAALVAPRPVIAIGGADLRRAASALRAGAAGVAVISAVAGAADPEQATRELVAVLAEAAAGGAGDLA